MIKSISTIRESVQSLRDDGVQRGDSTGFSCLDELYSIKSGTYTIVLGAPTHGKSEIIFELLINQALNFDKKSIILSPETGNTEEITMELIHKYLKQSAYRSNPYPCGDKEFYNALNWVDHYFAIADDEDKSYSFPQLMEEIGKFEKDKKCKFDNVMAEPWNELNHKLALNDNSGRQDLAIEEELTLLRRYCKKENKHAFLSFHPSFQTLVKDPVTKINFYEMPKAREAAGGQATLRKAFSWINIWRPPIGMLNGEGMPYGDNEVVVQVEKSKPKGIGKKGICTIYFDWQKNRYYELINGEKKYAFEHVVNFKNLNPPSEVFVTAVNPNELF